MPRRESDFYEVMVYVHHETDKAILVSTDNDKESAVWLAKSTIHIEKTGRPAVWNVTLPEWLAAEKDLA